MTATKNPYVEGTKEAHAWHRGYEGLVFLNEDTTLTRIYDTARHQAVTDCLARTNTRIVDEAQEGHIYYKLMVNDHMVYKSVLRPVVENLKRELDWSLCMK